MSNENSNNHHPIPISKPWITVTEKQAIIDVLESGHLAQGSRTTLLEQRFAQICHTRHAIAVSSGTAALYLALMAHGIGPGDEVITTPFTFAATAHSIMHTGAWPRFVDIDPETFNLDPNQIESAIKPSTKAILLVHLYGNPCHMTEISEIANRHGLAIIEDAAQAIGAHYHGRPVGGFGTGCFSLYATKNIMAGEGGMITTNDDVIAHQCKLIRNHGMERRYYHEIVGLNFRLSDLHAAIALAQLDRLDYITSQRRSHAQYLNTYLENLILPVERANAAHAWHQYTVRCNNTSGERCYRDQVVERLGQVGIGTGVFYPVPLHKQPSLRSVLGSYNLPITEQICQEVFSLPVYPQLTHKELDRIICETNSIIGAVVK